MQVRTEKTNKLAGEFRIIPIWAWTLAAIEFLIAQIMFNLAWARQVDAPPALVMVALGLMGGFVLGCYLLLLGYVNRDSGRRGMSRLLWTSVAILIPNGLGILLYFILRTPLRSSCPQCGKAIQGDFDFCPACRHRISVSCPGCRRSLGGNVVGADDSYCPYCGTSLHGQQAPISAV